MSEIAQIDWANLPLFVVLVIGLLGLGYVQLKIYQSAAQTQREALAAGATSVKASVDAFMLTLKEAREAYSETQKETREFYFKRSDELQERIKELTTRIKTLENEGAAKDKRIADLEEENKTLHQQVEDLRKRLDLKNGVSKRKTPKTDVSE